MRHRAPVYLKIIQVRSQRKDEQTKPYSLLVNDFRLQYPYFPAVPKPILGAINGACAGLGMVMALYTDIRFASEATVFTTAFSRRVEEGRTRLVLIAQEVARLTLALLTEHAAATRKLKDSRPPREVADDVQAQLQRLCAKRFLAATPWSALQHLPRYLKAVVLRLDKLRADPARDAARMAELRPLEQRWLRRQAELKGAADARLDEYRWLLEELRVSLFAQELRTPQPVSVKRLKRWFFYCGS